MIIPPPDDNWHTVTLRGAPHDGQVMRLPRSQESVTLHEGANATTYHRLREGAVELHSEERVARMFGGAR